MTVGYDKPLYILPFDHRGSFQKGMFGWSGTLTPEQTAEIAATKQVIYDGFKAAVAGGVPKDRAGILVDEQFGAAILDDAAKAGFLTAAARREERPGRVRLRVRRRLRPPHRDASIRPSARCSCATTPRATRASTRARPPASRRLSDYLHGSGRRFMFELLVPAEKPPSSSACTGTRRPTIASCGRP